jgi:hypothetical protein
VPLGWRWGLVAVVAVTAIGGLMQISLLSGNAIGKRVDAQVVHQQPIAPASCVSTSCNKGAPSAPAPPLVTASLWAVLLGMLFHRDLRVSKLLRRNAAQLPPGSSASLFHPPRFS